MKNITTYRSNTSSYYCLISLILLNLFDGIITYIGLKFEFYIEMNAILNNTYNYNSS